MNQEEKRIMKLMAKEVKRLREEKNLTQEVFAEIIGVSRDLIAKIETDKRKITSNVMIKILISKRNNVRENIEISCVSKIFRIS